MTFLWPFWNLCFWSQSPGLAQSVCLLQTLKELEGKQNHPRWSRILTHLHLGTRLSLSKQSPNKGLMKQRFNKSWMFSWRFEGRKKMSRDTSYIKQHNLIIFLIRRLDTLFSILSLKFLFSAVIFLSSSLNAYLSSFIFFHVNHTNLANQKFED